MLQWIATSLLLAIQHLRALILLCMKKKRLLVRERETERERARERERERERETLIRTNGLEGPECVGLPTSDSEAAVGKTSPSWRSAGCWNLTS